MQDRTDAPQRTDRPALATQGIGQRGPGLPGSNRDNQEPEDDWVEDYVETGEEWTDRILGLPDEEALAEVRGLLVHDPEDRDPDEKILAFLLRLLDEARKPDFATITREVCR